MDDDDAYKKYQKHHKWFNKLYLAESLGYNCGPCGLAPDVSGWYMVRPIYNLYGMGAFAEKKWIASHGNLHDGQFHIKEKGIQVLNKNNLFTKSLFWSSFGPYKW